VGRASCVKQEGQCAQKGRDDLKTGLGDGRNRRVTPSEAATSVEIRGCGVFDWHFFNGLVTLDPNSLAHLIEQLGRMGWRCVCSLHKRPLSITSHKQNNDLPCNWTRYTPSGHFDIHLFRCLFHVRYLWRYLWQLITSREQRRLGHYWFNELKAVGLHLPTANCALYSGCTPAQPVGS